MRGVEPLRLSTLDSKSSMSTNSITPAISKSGAKILQFFYCQNVIRIFCVVNGLFEKDYNFKSHYIGVRFTLLDYDTFRIDSRC